MEDLLRPVSTAYKHDGQEVHLVEAVEPRQAAEDMESRSLKGTCTLPATPEEALEALKSQPDFNHLGIVLEYLATSSDLSLYIPTPLGSQIINVLVSEIIPNYWSLLSTRKKTGGWAHQKERSQLLDGLRSVAGLSAMIARLKAVVEESKRAKGDDGAQSVAAVLKLYMEATEAILEGTDFLRCLYATLSKVPATTKQALWTEVVASLGGGRLLNTTAQAWSLQRAATNALDQPPWIADGLSYSGWMGQNIRQWAQDLAVSEDGEAWAALSSIMRKTMRLGNPDLILDALINAGIKNKALLRRIFSSMPAFERKPFLNSTIRLLTKRYLSSEPVSKGPAWWEADSGRVSAVAGLLESMFEDEDARMEMLVSWLTSLNGSGIAEPAGIRRSVMAVVSRSKSSMESVLEKTVQKFGDQLYIKHAPSLQQDVHTQVLLLAAGYVHRSSPLKLRMLSRSSPYLNAVSNRLASSSDRARFLGMVVAETISALVEPTGKQMDFKMEELQSTEAKWYKSLATVQDPVGPVDRLLQEAAYQQSPVKEVKQRTPHPPTSTSNPAVVAKNSRIISIEELEDASDDEHDEFMTYGKPDSDAEDSDDDPTLITRNKPTAPVYIRDLITYFRDGENYDRQKLALTTAPSLIRRKANFGSEVKDHVEELASLLMGLQDKYDLDNFNELRTQSMISVLLSDPPKMGPWYARTFFDGDYSVSQRASVLSTITMAARELGGHKQEHALSAVDFPSQKLAGRVHSTWDRGAVDSLAEKMSKAMIQPMAANFADRETGPDVLKVRTFSSRLAVESRRAAPTVNNLSNIIAESFFYPLTGRFFAFLKAYGGKNVIFESYLLSSYVKTLSLLLHASGTSTIELPQMTREFWDLLLALRSMTVGDKAVAEAVLFGFMTILELNEDKRRLAEQHGREMLETQRWVETLFTILGEGKDEEKSRMLAAGVLFRLREVVQKHQALLMGDLASF